MRTAVNEKPVTFLTSVSLFSVSRPLLYGLPCVAYGAVLPPFFWVLSWPEVWRYLDKEANIPYGDNKKTPFEAPEIERYRTKPVLVFSKNLQSKE